ncbi:MAG: hypothetical protein V3U18_03695 [Alphaproteobacteria bacterium]
MIKVCTLRTMLLALSLAFAASLGAIAGAHARAFIPWTEVMMIADADQDRGVTTDEVKELVKARGELAGFGPWMIDNFDVIDADGNDSLTLWEVKKHLMENGISDGELILLWWQ